MVGALLLMRGVSGMFGPLVGGLAADLAQGDDASMVSVKRLREAKPAAAPADAERGRGDEVVAMPKLCRGAGLQRRLIAPSTWSAAPGACRDAAVRRELDDQAVFAVALFGWSSGHDRAARRRRSGPGPCARHLTLKPAPASADAQALYGDALKSLIGAGARAGERRHASDNREERARAVVALEEAATERASRAASAAIRRVRHARFARQSSVAHAWAVELDAGVVPGMTATPRSRRNRRAVGHYFVLSLFENPKPWELIVAARRRGERWSATVLTGVVGAAMGSAKALRTANAADLPRRCWWASAVPSGRRDERVLVSSR